MPPLLASGVIIKVDADMTRSWSDCKVSMTSGGEREGQGLGQRWGQGVRVID